jgi:hypothetical protein
MDFNNGGTLEVSMIAYLKNIIKQFPGLINKKATSPAAEHLFMVRDKKEAKLLKEKQALAFHHTVAQLLFLSTRARQDIQTALAFLTTRVKNPNKYNWGKLKRVLKYLNGTKYMKLKLSFNGLTTPKWYVDGLHNAHADSRGHGGALFTMGKGATSS